MGFLIRSPSKKKFLFSKNYCNLKYISDRSLYKYYRYIYLLDCATIRKFFNCEFFCIKIQIFVGKVFELGEKNKLNL